MKLESVRHEYSQESDCCQPPAMGEWQTLIAETCDGGGGNYVVITTERWAIDAESLDEFVAALRAMLDKVGPGDSAPVESRVDGEHEWPVDAQEASGPGDEP